MPEHPLQARLGRNLEAEVGSGADSRRYEGFPMSILTPRQKKKGYSPAPGCRWMDNCSY